MLKPLENPSDLWLQRDHKHDLAFRPLETALEKGTVDAIYTQSVVLQHLQEATGQVKAVEDDFDVKKWAAPEFLEQAARELIKERWGKVSAEKLSMSAARMG